MLLSGTALVVISLAGFAFVYFVVFPTYAPAPFALSTPSGSLVPLSITAAQTPGDWKVAAGSKAGYRVREQLAGLPAQSDAVGQTTSIQGTATLTASAGSISVGTASFTVDVSTLTSDDGMRDQRIHMLGLESDQFPTATFTLSSPIVLPSTATTGQIVNVSAVGPLTLHGTTKTETIPLQARLSGAQIEVVGSITFPWSDFGMQAPSIGGFVSVTDMATMQFDLLLQHA